MLTARSASPSTLDVFRLTLEMLSKGSEIPQALRFHFDNVLKSALTLSQNPKNPPADISAEAIHLAFEMLSRNELRVEIEQITALNDLNRASAAKLLSEMEQAAVHS